MHVNRAEGEFTQLVARTSGFQPWRRVFHAANGIAVAWVAEHSGFEARTVLLLLGGLASVLLAFDLVRLRTHAVNELFFRLFTRLVSPREKAGIASSTWYTIGAWIALAAFPVHEAASGILVLALADPVASYLGRRWGRRALLGGTLLGTAAFVTVAFGVLALRHGWLPALVTAVVVTVVERVSWPLDDNLTVPGATAGTLVLLSALGAAP